MPGKLGHRIGLVSAVDGEGLESCFEDTSWGTDGKLYRLLNAGTCPPVKFRNPLATEVVVLVLHLHRLIATAADEDKKLRQSGSGSGGSGGGGGGGVTMAPRAMAPSMAAGGVEPCGCCCCGPTTTSGLTSKMTAFNL